MLKAPGGAELFHDLALIRAVGWAGARAAQQQLLLERAGLQLRAASLAIPSLLGRTLAAILGRRPAEGALLDMTTRRRRRFAGLLRLVGGHGERCRCGEGHQHDRQGCSHPNAPASYPLVDITARPVHTAKRKNRI